MSLLVTCDDGPLAGASFTVPSCPRLVRCVRSVSGKDDILNLPDDQPAADETVHWYRWDGQPAQPVHVCARGRGSGWYSIVHLQHVALEVFPAPREEDCGHGCCKAGDEGLFSEMVRA